MIHMGVATLLSSHRRLAEHGVLDRRLLAHRQRAIRRTTGKQAKNTKTTNYSVSVRSWNEAVVRCWLWVTLAIGTLHETTVVGNVLVLLVRDCKIQLKLLMSVILQLIREIAQL